ILSVKISISTSPSEVESVAVGFAMGAEASSSAEQPSSALDGPAGGARGARGGHDRGPRIATIGMKNNDMAGAKVYNPPSGNCHEGPSQDVGSQSGRLQVFAGSGGQVQIQAVSAVHGAAERLSRFVLQQALDAHASVLRNRDRTTGRAGGHFGSE